jgi:hypothetical protein
MSQSIEPVYPKLTDDNLKLLESQISNLEYLGRLRSRCGKLPLDVSNQIKSVIDGLTSATLEASSKPVELDEEMLLSFKRAWTEFVLASAKEWPTTHPNHYTKYRHLSWSELWDVMCDDVVTRIASDTAFLDMFRSFCEKSQRSPESPQ